MRKVPRARCLWVLAVVLASAAPASAKSYSADRFDSVVRVLPGGALDVTETVVFRFEEGTFREVFRELRERSTDGIEVVSVQMDGVPLPAGSEIGTAEIRHRQNRVRVTWRFAPVEGITRTFALRYTVRGVVRESDEGDLLMWRALPTEHQYRIRSSTTIYELPVAPSGTPHARSRNAGTPEIDTSGTTVRVSASEIRSNGWVETTIPFPRGSVVAAAPAWQQRAREIQAKAPRWLFAAALLAAAGLVILVAWRQSYDRPAKETFRIAAPQQAPPDTLPATLGGVLAANGRTALEHAMAAVFSLAERGEIEIEERPRSLGQQSFEITRRGRSGRVAEHERAALETMFKGEPAAGASVPLGKARSRLTVRIRRFARAVEHELHAAGLLDPHRKALRDRYNRAGIWLLLAAAVAVAPAAFLIDDHGAWPMLLPAAGVVLAITSFIMGATITPLSNEGVRRASRWREYRRHLRSVVQGKGSAGGQSAAAVLPFAVALGLAGGWAKLLRRSQYETPAWFRALDGDYRATFPAFIAAGGAGATSSHGGGSVAGGGASGAR